MAANHLTKSSLEFETPENIRVGYQPAGLGTRYLAWFLDNILLTIAIVVIFFLALLLGVVTESVMRQFGENMQGLDNSSGTEQSQKSLRFLQYFVGLATLAWGFGSFIYFGCMELWLRGQTFGKRMLGLRVVRVDGFALDASSIFVRNVFRVVDQFPPVWVVPFLSKRSQRFGDMAAGTTVVVDKPEPLSEIRKVLAEFPAAEARFTFDSMTLKKARSQDFEAIEKILNRWDSLAAPQQDALLNQIVPPLVARLQIMPPATVERLTFLEDLLAAEYRRQHRNL
jgi:uncharacterized RDD family membrane protein YckC